MLDVVFQSGQKLPTSQLNGFFLQENNFTIKMNAEIFWYTPST